MSNRSVFALYVRSGTPLRSEIFAIESKSPNNDSVTFFYDSSFSSPIFLCSFLSFLLFSSSLLFLFALTSLLFFSPLFPFFFFFFLFSSPTSTESFFEFAEFRRRGPQLLTDVGIVTQLTGFRFSADVEILEQKLFPLSSFLCLFLLFCSFLLRCGSHFSYRPFRYIFSLFSSLPSFLLFSSLPSIPLWPVGFEELSADSFELRRRSQVHGRVSSLTRTRERREERWGHREKRSE